MISGLDSIITGRPEEQSSRDKQLKHTVIIKFNRANGKINNCSVKGSEGNVIVGGYMYSRVMAFIQAVIHS